MAHGAAPDQVAVRLHRFRELRVGPTVVHSPTLPVVPMSDGMGDALVGADFLQGRRVWLSFATQRVFVTPIERTSGDRRCADRATTGRQRSSRSQSSPTMGGPKSRCGALATRRKPAC